MSGELNNTVTWLHISDLHMCRPNKAWEADYILEKLLEDITRLNQEHELKPDIIFFTGDAAFGNLGSGKGKSIKDQLEDAEMIFMELRETLDIPKERFFMVPGNHDVDRNNVIEYMQNGFAAEMKKQPTYEAVEKKLEALLQGNGKAWKAFIERLDDYKQYLSEFQYTHLLTHPDHLIHGNTIDVNGVKVGIAGMNSVWSYHKDAGKSDLWLGGHWQIHNLRPRIKDAQIKIALMHHPINWFNQTEDPKTARQLGNHFDFCLHGHEHQGWVNHMVGEYVAVSAGAAYAGSAKEMGYNVVKVDYPRKTAHVYLRNYESTSEKWMQRVIPDRTDNLGVIKLTGLFPIAIEPTPAPPHPQANKTPDNKPEPQIKPDSPESRGIFGRGKTIGSIVSTFKKTPFVALTGMPGIGKTALVKEIQYAPSIKDKTYYRFELKDDTNLDTLFANMAHILGCRDKNPKANFQLLGQYDFSSLKPYAKVAPPALIHLDDFYHAYDGKQWLKNDIRAFLAALPEYYPNTRFILESRKRLDNVFSADTCPLFPLRGLEEADMLAYFRTPFFKESVPGWEFDDAERVLLFKWLGGEDGRGGAHPFAMVLLAGLAKEKGLTPTDILKKYQAQKDHVIKDLEVYLFNDYYSEVLTDPQRHMLRLCALYRGDIPVVHVGALSRRAKGADAFEDLTGLSLINRRDNHSYYLHAIIKELTMKRIRPGSDDYFADHDTIARQWVEQIARVGNLSLHKLEATNQAFYHLTEAQEFEQLFGLSGDLLRQDNNMLSKLDEIYQYLRRGDHPKGERTVVEFILHLYPDNPKYHRFLGEIIERINGRGDKEAFEHYKEAHRLLPTFPQYLANIGRNLLSAGKPGEFVEMVKQLDERTFAEVMNDHVISIYSRCLQEAGDEAGGSRLRQHHINKGTQDPIFYNDEAKYLLKQGRPQEAMAVIEKAEANNAVDMHTNAIKADVLEQLGRGPEASASRQRQIDNGSTHSAFYNDEAKYLLNQGRPQEAMAVIEKAEANGCANEFIQSVKADVLEQLGRGPEASANRQRHIDNRSTNPAFYNDEAIYRFKQGQYHEALAVLQKAVERKCDDDYIHNTMTKIKRALGKE